MTSRLTCSNCGAAIPAELLADDHGERLFGCCSCGMATVEYEFANSLVGPSSLADADWRGVVHNDVASFSWLFG